MHTAQRAGLCLQWRSGKFSGLGMERFADGTLFVGEYEDGLADGSGVAIYLDGSMHEGHFAAGATLLQGMLACTGTCGWHCPTGPDHAAGVQATVLLSNPPSPSCPCCISGHDRLVSSIIGKVAMLAGVPLCGPEPVT